MVELAWGMEGDERQREFDEENETATPWDYGVSGDMKPTRRRWSRAYELFAVDPSQNYLVPSDNDVI